MPISLKDQLLTAGWPTLRGSRAVDPAGPWNEDAPVTARLREAGLVLLGKTTTSEFGWRGATDTLLCGITRNPWNLGKTPGGSSGGAAVAVASGLGPLAIGTDGGGSVRIPAAFTGVLGFKPSFGRVPAYPPSYMGPLAHVGSLARTTRDAAQLMNIITRPDPRDTLSLPYSDVDYGAALDTNVKGLRVGFSARLGYVERIDTGVAEPACQAAHALGALGAHVEEIDHVIDNPVQSFFSIFGAGSAHFFDSLAPEAFAKLEPPLHDFVEACRKVSLSDYMNALDGRAKLAIQLSEFFKRFDVLLTPAVATTAFDVGRILPQDEYGEDWLMWSPFTYPFNLSGHPAASVPCGLHDNGLPLGLQIVTKPFQDLTMLRVAHALESVLPHLRPSLVN